MNIYLIIILSSLLSSVITILILTILYKIKLKKILKKELDQISDQIETRVSRGVMDAGNRLLPELRKEVGEGLKDAMSAALSGEFIEKTAQSAVKTGTTIMESGLNILLGKKSSGNRD